VARTFHYLNAEENYTTRPEASKKIKCKSEEYLRRATIQNGARSQRWSPLIRVILEMFHKESLERSRGVTGFMESLAHQVEGEAMGVQDIHRLNKSINAGR